MKTRLVDGFKDRQMKRQREIDKLKTMQEKRELAKFYKESYDISSNIKDFEKITKKELLIKLEMKWQIKKEQIAALRIQTKARMFICRNRYLNLIKSRHDSATMI